MKHMRRLMLTAVIVITLLVYGCVGLAEGNDIKSMSSSALISLQKDVNSELTARPEFRRVKVPTGAYAVGEDIPARQWTITASDGMCEVYWGKALDEYGVEIPYSEQIATLDDWGKKTSVSWNLLAGTYIVVNRNSVTFTPYVPRPLEFRGIESDESAEGFDLSSMGFDELVELQTRITSELITRTDFKEILVPTGVYKVGEDIPAGKWTITASEGMCEVYWGKKLDAYGVEIPYSDRISTLDDWGNKTSVNWDLVEGTYIVVNRNAVTFSPYLPTTLGF